MKNHNTMKHDEFSKLVCGKWLYHTKIANHFVSNGSNR